MAESLIFLIYVKQITHQLFSFAERDFPRIGKRKLDDDAEKVFTGLVIYRANHEKLIGNFLRRKLSQTAQRKEL